MKLEIWSDPTCPWCGLGQHRLDQALATFAHRDDVEILHRSFRLDPGLPVEPRPVRELFADRHGMTETQLAAVLGPLEALAASEGLAPYCLEDNVLGNSGLAHELLALAASRGLDDVAWRRLYRAYFGERRSIFEVESLVALGQEVGLDPDEVRAALRDGRFRARVDHDDREARARGATGIPFMVIDGRRVIAGAQPAGALARALELAWQERAAPEPAAQGGSCGPEGCSLPE